MSDIKPHQPPCESKQFDENKGYLHYANDQYNNEIPSDEPKHGEATPGMGGSPDYAGNQYAPAMKYGGEVSPPGVSREQATPNVHEAARGKES